MPTVLHNSFTSFSFTPEDEIQARILNPLQKMRIQTDLAVIAEQILELKFDSENPGTFVQDDSYLKGQMSVLKVMLLQSEEAEKAARQFNN